MIENNILAADEINPRLEIAMFSCTSKLGVIDRLIVKHFFIIA